MALVKLSATPYSIKYSITEDTGSRSRAEVVADCAAGPLREKLRLAPVWLDLDLAGEISVYGSGRALSGVAVSALFRTVLGSDSLEASTGGGGGVIEVRFHHSAVR